MRFGPVLAAGALALGLSGCATPVGGTVALQRVGEHVHTAVEVCRGHTVEGVTLREIGGLFHDEWDFDELVVDSASIDIGVFADSVTLLDTGHPFTLATTSSDESTVEPVEFWSDQLAALEDGEYLTSDGVKDEAAYESFVEDRCG